MRIFLMDAQFGTFYGILDLFLISDIALAIFWLSQNVQFRELSGG